MRFAVNGDIGPRISLAAQIQRGGVAVHYRHLHVHRIRSNGARGRLPPALFAAI